jgi:raffinose/stachyose/melibiose transport system substrate-binding protein
MVRKWVVVGVLATTLVTQACSSATSTTGPAASGAAPAASSQPAASPAAENVKVVYWSMFSEGEPFQVILADAIKSFQAENPNISVDVNWAGRKVLTLYQGALATGTQVDIVDQANWRIIGNLVKNDLALPMDQYLNGPGYDGTGKWIDSFVAGSFDSQKAADGKIYMIPRDDYIRAVFYNKSLLAGLGITPPTNGVTWDDFTAMAAKIKAAAIVPIGVDADDSGYNALWFINLSVREAGLAAVQAAAIDKTGKAWQNPAFLAAATKVRSLVDQGFFEPGYSGSVYPAAQVNYVNGKYAMMLMGSWLPAEMSQQTPAGFKAGMFAFPDVTGGQGNNIVEHWSNSYAVLTASKHPDAAVRLIQYLDSQKVGEALTGIGSSVPFVNVPAPATLADQPKILATAQQMQFDTGFGATVPDWETNVFRNCDDKFFTGPGTPQSLLDCLSSSSATYWTTH